MRLARWKWTVAVPGAWICIALLAHVYGGGENLTLGVGLLPGILVAKLWGHNSSGSLALGSPESWTLIAFGIAPMIMFGMLLDWVRVRFKIFVIALAVGIAVIGIVIGASFVSEARRSSLARAVNKFDLDQPPRAIALVLLCVAAGYYLSLPLASAIACARAGRTT